MTTRTSARPLPGGRRALWLTALLGAQACVRAEAPPPASAPVEPMGSRPSYVATFRLQDAGDDAQGVPRTRVDFIMHSAGARSVTEALGTEAGGCVERPAREGELLRVACWWGPDESHWVARRQAWGVALLRAEGPAEALPPAEAGSGAWETRGRVDLPSGTVVTRLSD